ncbi:NAD-dependent epimerase/dehydratase family protein [Brevibacillus massiliensis]|uniref:NAD-dependent epimerase/dehydratase family protein n=1 Tax=Brevibacillus massiliensis TaxID=1118054 RepID=UPI00035D60C8|nr:NAD-dependent epimerase/dehydratase family protein [Brevibacillus massiliensis]
MNRKRCLVTGGAGFIGSHLAERLLDLGHEVAIVDNFYREALCDRPKLPGPLPLIKGSTADKQLMDAIIPEFDVVFHLAAILGVKTTMTRPVEMIEANVEGTRNVLAAAYRSGCKVVFASSSEVYGKGTPPFAEENDRVYGATAKLRWIYAVAKTLEETLCLGYGDKGLPVTILRYFNIYGPRAKEGPYAGVIPRFIRAALAGNDLLVYGDGTQTRCFTYVSDAVEATARAVDPKADQEILNVGSAHQTSIGALAVLVKRLTGSSSRIVNVPFEQVYSFGFEEIPNRFPDMRKTKRILDFSARIGLEEGLARTIDWYRARGGERG